MGVMYVHGIVHVSRDLKEELAWATDKWIEVSSSIMLYHYETKELHKLF